MVKKIIKIGLALFVIVIIALYIIGSYINSYNNNITSNINKGNNVSPSRIDEATKVVPDNRAEVIYYKNTTTGVLTKLIWNNTTNTYDRHIINE